MHIRMHMYTHMLMLVDRQASRGPFPLARTYGRIQAPRTPSCSCGKRCMPTWPCLSRRHLSPSCEAPSLRNSSSEASRAWCHATPLHARHVVLSPRAAAPGTPGRSMPLSPIRQVPGLKEGYLGLDGCMQASVSVDGGYYTKTPDNLPLIGRVPGAPAGSFICAGLSGYGVMAANAAGELLAAHVAGEDRLPQYASYADTFSPTRWMDEEYKARVASGAASQGLQI